MDKVFRIEIELDVQVDTHAEAQAIGNQILHGFMDTEEISAGGVEVWEDPVAEHRQIGNRGSDVDA